MKKIDFAEGLSLPIDAATQTFGVLARKRAGKSYAAGKLIEGFAENDVQFVVGDPVGNWYALRLAADGKKPGIDVPVLGGLHGDIPLDAGSGKLIADTVVDSGRSFVLDVSQFSLGERKRFMTAFGEQLWQRQKGLKDPRPIHVVLEEAQLFLPQQPMPDERHMLGIWTEIVRLGGNKGVGVTLISQRPQSVAKEALTQVECLIVLQVNGVPEKKALKEWIVEKGLETNLVDELPFLPQGTAYIWSPQWLEHFGKHKIKPKWTFDGGATPKVGVKRAQADLKPIDLEALREQMGAAVKTAEANDPSALKKRIRELEVEVSKKGGGASAAELGRLQAEAVAVQREFEHMHKNSIALFKQELQEELNNVTKFISSWQSEIKAMPSKLNGRTTPGSLGPRRDDDRREHSVRNRAATGPVGVKVGSSAPTEGSFHLNRGVRSMMRALASRDPNGLTKNQLATLAGLSPSSGTFSTYLSKLRTLGYLYENPATGELLLTPTGGLALGEKVAQPLSTEELVTQWTSKFPGKVGEMLQELVGRFPSTLSKEELGEIVGITHTSGTWSTYLSKLRSNGLVTVDRSTGQLKASEDLFL